MRILIVLLFFGNSRVRGDDFAEFHGSSDHDNNEFVDIYTNHRDYQQVLDNYYDISRRPNHRRFQKLPSILHDTSLFKSVPRIQKITPAPLRDSEYLDRIDFHYPSIEFVHKDNTDTNLDAFSDKYVFIQSQKVTTDDSREMNDYRWTRRPRFKTQKYTSTSVNYETPTTQSYVQKIPKPPVSSSKKTTRYEELIMTNTNATAKESTKSRIGALLKTYLAKLYSQKYNSSRPNGSPSYSKVSDQVVSDYPKTKFMDGTSLWSLKNKSVNKIKKIFSLFTIVQFNNTQCNASNSAGSYQGICYTAVECTNINGTALGDCASGYGVCCIAAGTCGGSASQNCSYFESPNYPDYYPSDGAVVVPTTIAPTTTTANPSPTPDPRLHWYYYRNPWGRQTDDTLSCGFSVSKLSSNISKMRIDFLDLELTGPTNGTCADERLVISGQNTNNQVPIICGYNTGQHVYVDVSALSGPLQLSVLSASGSRKRFQIRICQFEDSCLEPSSNCLQYYTGVSGMISSFNYDQAAMFSRSTPGYFNNLNYAICIRREAGYCSITFVNVANRVEYPFQLTNVDDSGSLVIPPGQAGADIFNCPNDYIVIGDTRLCGDKFNDGTINDNYTMNAAVTDTGAGPIVIPVRTDSAVAGIGFKLFYTQNRCSTT